jgi:hypothetical protein
MRTLADFFWTRHLAHLTREGVVPVGAPASLVEGHRSEFMARLRGEAVAN